MVDASSPNLQEQRAEVDRVLEEIGADSIPQILVYNKVDKLASTAQPRVACDWLQEGVLPARRRVFVSASQSVGLDMLRQLIAQSMDNQGALHRATQEDPRFRSTGPFEVMV